MESQDSLAVRRRPKTLNQLYGQDSAVAILRRQFQSGKISRSFLITGPTGVGKTTTARIIAHYLLCENPNYDTVEPCLACETCLRLAGYSPGPYHHTIIEVNFADKGIDAIRAVIANAMFCSPWGDHKIFILDELQYLPEKAQMALSTSLEHPGNGIIFILIADDAKKILHPIKNRCKWLELFPVADEDMSDLLSKVASEESIELSSETLNFIVEQSCGHVRDALELLERSHVISSTKTGTYTETKAQAYRSYLLGLYSGDMVKTLKGCESIRRLGHELAHEKVLFALHLHFAAVRLVFDSSDVLGNSDNVVPPSWNKHLKSDAPLQGTLTPQIATIVACGLQELIGNCGKSLAARDTYLKIVCSSMAIANEISKITPSSS